MKVVLITDEFPGKDGKSQSLADTCDEADALSSCGQGNATLQFPAMDKVIGTMDYIESQIGGWAGCVNEDGSFEAELEIIGHLRSQTALTTLQQGDIKIWKEDPKWQNIKLFIILTSSLPVSAVRKRQITNRK